MRGLVFVLLGGCVVAGGLCNGCGNPAAGGPPNGESGGRPFRASPQLAEYAQQIARAARPGARCRQFVSQFVGTPLEQVAAVYRAVDANWRYVPDPVDDVDWLQSAEDTLGPLVWRGDCEDEAVLMMALLQAMPDPIDCRLIVAGPTNSGKSGHAFAEVRISADRHKDPKLLTRLAKRWGALGLDYRVDDAGVWLPLQHGCPPRIYEGADRFAIYPDGKILKFE
jgi:hypothetical protein